MGQVNIQGMRNIAVYAEDNVRPLTCKTVAGLALYRTGDITAVVDSTKAGRDATTELGLPILDRIPIVKDIASAAELGAETLLMAHAPATGVFPDAWRAAVLDAIDLGMNVASGLPYYVSDDGEICAAARAKGVTIWDVRKPPATEILPRRRPTRPGSNTVLTVGSDISVGKMTTAIELDREARRRGLDSGFVATGQTGILIADEGLPVDHLVADYMTGHVEDIVARGTDRFGWVFVEGQGALNDPATSPVALSLIHGARPDALVLCHRAGSRSPRSYPDCGFESLRDIVEMNELAAGWLSDQAPARVVGISLITWGLSDREAAEVVSSVEDECGLPVADVLRHGVDVLLAAIQSAATPRSPVG